MSTWEGVGRLSDESFHRLRSAFGGQGQLLLDVPLCAGSGGWPEGTMDHRMTAAWLPDAAPAAPVYAADVDVAGAVAGREVVLVMAEGYGDRPMVGWLLGGGEMFSRSYPMHGLLRHAVVVDEGHELNMGRVYANLGIEVVVVNE